MQDGLFIVVEGAERVEEQLDLLSIRLQKNGYIVKRYDFPSNGSSSYFVQQYRSNNYGTKQTVNPYLASLFFSLDRYDVASEIEGLVSKGVVVLATGFIATTMVEQATKFVHPEERRGYYVWLDHMEHVLFKSPRPAKSFILSSSISATKQQMYDELAQLFPRDFERVDIKRNEQDIDTNVLHRMIWEKIEPLLPSRTNTLQAKNTGVTKELPTMTILGATRIKPFVIEYQDYTAKDGHDNYYYFIPKLNPNLKKQYVKTMDKLFATYTELVKKIPAETSKSLYAVLPLSIKCKTSNKHAELNSENRENGKLNLFVNKHLQETHGDVGKPVSMISFTPKNELDLVPDILYTHSGLKIDDIKSQTQSWSYSQRKGVFDNLQPSSDNFEAFSSTHYCFEIVSDFLTYVSLLEALPHATTQIQRPTPRNGFDIPELVDDKVELTELFQSSFDLSLELHNNLWVAGYVQEAEYAVLLGHKFRWSLTLSAQELRHLTAQKQLSVLVDQLTQSVSVVHPLTAKLIRS